MTVEKDGRPASPVHVHVDDHTPVHVHVKKPKKSTSLAKAHQVTFSVNIYKFLPLLGVSASCYFPTLATKKVKVHWVLGMLLYFWLIQDTRTSTRTGPDTNGS